MAKKVILGTDIARDAFKVKVNDNFTELYDNSVYQQGQIEDKLSTSHNTDANAHDDIRESINTLAPHLNELVTDVDGVHGLKIESGTWTPSLAGSEVEGSHTYATRIGRYYRIGNIVLVVFHFQIASKDSAMQGNLRIADLPFNPIHNYFTANFNRIDRLILSDGYSQVLGYMPNAQPYIILTSFGSSKIRSNLNEESAENETIISGSMVYSI